jgi:hypothetical protein
MYLQGLPPCLLRSIGDSYRDAETLKKPEIKIKLFKNIKYESTQGMKSVFLFIFAHPMISSLE